MEQKTALYESHIEHGGKMVEYAGYLLPVQYSGIAAEHIAVRTAAGMFDVSHMGEFNLSGADAEANLQNLLTNDISNMRMGQVRYSPMCNKNGGIVDDLLIYCKGDKGYLIVVNAANRKKDFEWMKSKLFGDANFTDVSDGISQIAIQGPKAEAIIKNMCDEEDIPEKYYSFNEEVLVGGVECLLSKTGYTGEKGFEIYCGIADATRLWRTLMIVGQSYGLIPCGLGARDTLRLEAAMPLYGHEMSDEITPLETALERFVKMDKDGGFIGREALIKRGEADVTRTGILIDGRGIARGGERIFANGEDIGFVTSGTLCPSSKKNIAMCIIKKEFAVENTALELEIRGKKFSCKTVKLPFERG